MNEAQQPLIFTLEDDNAQAPSYDEQRHLKLEESLNEIRQRYRHSETILSQHQQKLSDKTKDKNQNTPDNHTETDFRLPEIEMPPQRDYSLDDIPDDLFDNQADPDGLISQASDPLSPNDDDDDSLAKLFKRYQEERSQSSIKIPPEPVLPVIPEPTPPHEMSDDERKQAYLAYLDYKQNQHNQRVQQSAIAEQDIALLMQEDWLAAQDALQHDGMPKKVLHLQADEQAHYHQNIYANDGSLPSYTMNVYDLPDLPSTRKIRVLSEQTLVAELQQKLRPHLSQAVAGLMHHVLQRKLANLSYDLQMMLNEETPRLVEDVLAHNMETILREIKERL